jgi:hypothetical protein
MRTVTGTTMKLTLELLDTWRRPVTAEVSVHRDLVEVHCRQKLVGIANRELLSAWLRTPTGDYCYDEIAWLNLGSGVAICIEDVVPAFVLGDAVVSSLREYL